MGEEPRQRPDAGDILADDTTPASKTQTQCAVADGRRPASPDVPAGNQG